jgi:hypothetical protein
MSVHQGGGMLIRAQTGKKPLHLFSMGRVEYIISVFQKA